MKHKIFMGIFAAITAACLWGLSGTVGQFIFEEKNIDVQWLITCRLLVAGVLLISYAKFKQKLHISQIWKNKRDVKQLIIFSIAGMLSVQYTYFAAIKNSNAATATVLQFIGPVIIAVYLAIKNKTLPNKKVLIAIILAASGTYLLVTHGRFNNLSITPLALTFGVASALALAIYTLQPLALLKKYQAALVIGWAMTLAGVILSFFKAPWDVQITLDIEILISLFIIFIPGTLVAFSLYLHSVKITGGQKASLLASAEPLSATLLSVLWLNTPFSSYDWIGTIFIIATVFLIGRNK